MRGASYDYLNQPEQAKDDYTKCISLFPDNEFAYVNRGAILFEENRYKEALDDFNKAISLSPGGNYYLNRSYCYFKLGDLIKAKEDMQTAIRKGETVSVEYQNALK